MQYQRVEDMRSEDEEEVGPSVPKEFKEKPGSEFLQTTMGLIDSGKD